MAYGYRVFTVVDETLSKVLWLVPQLLWSLMWNTCTTLEATLNGNLIQTIITNPVCFHLQVKSEALVLPWGENQQNCCACFTHTSKFCSIMCSSHTPAGLPSQGIIPPLVTTLQWSSHRQSLCSIFLFFKIPCVRWLGHSPCWQD